MPTVNLSRLSQHHFEATNSHGGTVSFGRKWAGEFTPVELLLVAIAGCTAMDVDAITVKRSSWLPAYPTPHSSATRCTAQRAPDCG
jgi:uncharacterized OsmC-like protein